MFSDVRADSLHCLLSVRNNCSFWHGRQVTRSRCRTLLMFSMIYPSFQKDSNGHVFLDSLKDADSKDEAFFFSPSLENFTV
jgi:hypothetical protein